MQNRALFGALALDLDHRSMPNTNMRGSVGLRGWLGNCAMKFPKKTPRLNFGIAVTFYKAVPGSSEV